ncbi:SigE family RNA polymerase sigma factor [Hamadaea sp. NPDC051192]|uniref:SigE family RNA polymerase sigma factor n=1 Tax=Hamadaea sp. NPDC051192 TaxID=3154940 RepID=UPI00344A18AB
MADGVEFEEFVRTRSHHLLRLAYALTGDHAHAEDLVQTALARSWSAWRRVTGDPEPYVRRILVNTFNSWWGRRWRGELPTETLPDRIATAPQSSVDDRDEVRQALLRLPRQQRAVVVLRYLEDLSEAQTAELLGITPGAVKTHSSRALTRLRLDPSLAGLPDAPPAGIERVVAVQERISRRRRTKLVTIGAACAVILAIILGYALAPAVSHRSIPPTERKIGVFQEYQSGYHVVASRTVPFAEAGRTTLTWRLTSLDYGLQIECAHQAVGLVVTVGLQIGDTPTPALGCERKAHLAEPSSRFYLDEEFWASAGLAVGDEVTATIVLYAQPEGTVSSGADALPTATPPPAAGTIAVAVSESVPFERYPLPTRPARLKPMPTQQPYPLDETVSATERRPLHLVWAGNLCVQAQARTPGYLHILVDGVRIGSQSWWDYGFGEHARSYTTDDLRRVGIALPLGTTITVTVEPQYMTGDWQAYLYSEKSPPTTEGGLFSPCYRPATRVISGTPR